MKLLKYLSILAIIISISGPIFNLSCQNGADDKTELQDFIIGKWESLYKQPTLEIGTYYKLEFFDTGILIYNAKSQITEFYNIEYKYKFINKDRILITNLRAGETEWEIIREKKFLMIRMSNSGNYIVFQRRPAIMWGVIAISLAILTITTLFWSSRTTSGNTDIDKLDIKTSTREINKYKKYTYVFLYRFATIILFGIGILIANKLDRWSLFLQIDEPWQPIILLEMGILMLVSGARLARAYWVKKTISYFSKNVLNQYFGVLLIGGGVYGVFISLFNLVFSLVFEK